jgi:hypothetical protein
MRSRQWLLAQRHVYEGSRNTAEQDAIAVIDEMLAPTTACSSSYLHSSAECESTKCERRVSRAPGFQVR